jgi:hypothetical protein
MLGMLGMLGVVVDDVSAESDFTTRLFDQLAHLKRNRAGKGVKARPQNGCCLFACAAVDLRLQLSAKVQLSGVVKMVVEDAVTWRAAMDWRALTEGCSASAGAL